jgi:hypothetical protein
MKRKIRLVLGDKNFESEGGMLLSEDEETWFYFEPHEEHTKLYMGSVDWPDFGRSCDVKQFTGKNTDKMNTYEAIHSWGAFYGFDNFDPMPVEFQSRKELNEWLEDFEVTR